MDWQSNVWTDLKAMIGAAWPDMTSIWRVVRIERRDWVTMIDDKELAAPWVVVDMPKATFETEFAGGSNQTYRQSISVFWINKVGDGTDELADISAHMMSLQDYLLNNTSTHFQILPYTFAIDSSETNPINHSMLQADMPYVAGEFSFDLIAGFTP